MLALVSIDEACSVETVVLRIRPPTLGGIHSSRECHIRCGADRPAVKSDDQPFCSQVTSARSRPLQCQCPIVGFAISISQKAEAIDNKIRDICRNGLDCRKGNRACRLHVCSKQIRTMRKKPLTATAAPHFSSAPDSDD